MLRGVRCAVSTQLDHGLVSLLHHGAGLGVWDRLRGLLQRGQQSRQEHRCVIRVVHHLWQAVGSGSICDPLHLVLYRAIPCSRRYHRAIMGAGSGNQRHVRHSIISGCSSLVISWLPSNGYLNRSVLASEKLCNNLYYYYYCSRCSSLSISLTSRPLDGLKYITGVLIATSRIFT